ncbi:MAG TPA: cytochrome c oxidase assembly protein [bacterium]|nr:cytochrome c oxidase assembly protein [bacterium]
MTLWRALAATWSWEPSVVAGCAVLAGAYLGLAGRAAPRRAVFFLAGVAALLLALDSPLDGLGDRYLFSAHMLQHMLLVLLVPPLLLLGIPPDWARAALRVPALRRAERGLGHPVAAWVLGIGTMCAWHVPVLYNAALAHGFVHVAQHLSFLVTSVIFWWPVCAPLPEARMPALGAVGYLLAAALASSGLGIILTFSPPGLYPAYLHPADPLGLLPTIRGTWGLSPAADQQIGGLLMWVPGGLAYLCAILGTLGRWYREPDAGPSGAVDRTTAPGPGRNGAPRVA